MVNQLVGYLMPKLSLEEQVGFKGICNFPKSI